MEGFRISTKEPAMLLSLPAAWSFPCIMSLVASSMPCLLWYWPHSSELPSKAAISWSAHSYTDGRVTKRSCCTEYTISAANYSCPCRSEVLVNCHVPKSSREQLEIISPLSENPDMSDSIFAAYSVCQADGRNVIVRLMNTSNVDIQLQAGQKFEMSQYKCVDFVAISRVVRSGGLD
eukprot:gene6933-12549_t